MEVQVGHGVEVAEQVLGVSPPTVPVWAASGNTRGQCKSRMYSAYRTRVGRQRNAPLDLSLLPKVYLSLLAASGLRHTFHG